MLLDLGDLLNDRPVSRVLCHNTLHLGLIFASGPGSDFWHMIVFAYIYVFRVDTQLMKVNTKQVKETTNELVREGEELRAWVDADLSF